MALTDKAVKAAKPTTQQYKLADSDGMYLLVYPTGRKAWKLKYRINGAEKKLHLGYYPEVSLLEARNLRHEAKKLIRDGIDPAAPTKGQPQDAEFHEVALEWFEKNKVNWSPRHAQRQLTSIEEMKPFIGHMKIGDIEAPHVLAGIRAIEQRKAFETAHKTKQCISQIFFYAIATGAALRNPANDLRGALEQKPKQKNNPHLNAKELPAFLKAFSQYNGYVVTRLAFKFLLLTFVRTQEMRFAEWSEIDWENKQWRIPAEKMKAKRVHIVPLSTQALAVLEELKLHTGKGRLIFPQRAQKAYTEKKPISENAILSVIDSIGYKGRITGHGFRGTASTILNENGFPVEAIERQLAHVDGNKVRAAYNHAEYLPKRKEMMQWWADCISVNH